MAIVETKTKREAIRIAAARLFRDKGYSATSMRDLAEAVDLKAPSIYNHFLSKEEILRHICFENARRFLEGLSEIEKMKFSSGEKLRALIRMHILIATEDATSIIAFNDEWRHLSEPFLSEFSTIRRDYERRFQAIIEEGIQKGEIIDINPYVVTYTIFSSMRWLYDWFKPGRSISAEDIEGYITRMLMEGLEKP